MTPAYLCRSRPAVCSATAPGSDQLQRDGVERDEVERDGVERDEVEDVAWAVYVND